MILDSCEIEINNFPIAPEYHKQNNSFFETDNEFSAIMEIAATLGSEMWTPNYRFAGYGKLLCS